MSLIPMITELEECIESIEQQNEICLGHINACKKVIANNNIKKFNMEKELTDRLRNLSKLEEKEEPLVFTIDDSGVYNHTKEKEFPVETWEGTPFKDQTYFEDLEVDRSRKP